MFRYTPPHKLHIVKAKIYPSGLKYKVYQKMADSMASFLVGDLHKGFKMFQSKIELEKLTEALAIKDFDKIMALHPAAQLADEFTDYKDNLRNLLTKSGTAAIDTLPKIVKPKFTFDLDNKRIDRRLDKEVGRLVQNITDEGRLALKSLVNESWRRGLPARDSAKLIKGTFGLNDRQSVAVLNYKQSLEAQGVTGLKQDKLVQSYTDRSLRYRERMIANTESIRAVNMGQLELWNQTADAGLMERDTMRKVWIVTLDDMTCPYCSNMGGQEVKLDQLFSSSEFGSVEGPPLHPNCRCMMNLEEATK